ncbi:MAG TPA: hypothetical protein VMB25_01370 [Bryobacteraceae bacterium]|nr:hypothetical protein [Bryobacteraceae bacterium]
MARTTLVCFLMAAASLAAESGAGLHWNTPSGWKAEAPRPMRLATYTIAAAAGDKAGGECGVYYFGPGQGGSVEANLDRWIGQFLQGDGKPSRSAAKIETRTVHGLKITSVDVSGAYTGMGGPMAKPGPAVPGYRLLGAIVEGPKGSVFLKFTGPERTVTRNRAAFDRMLASFEPAG